MGINFRSKLLDLIYYLNRSRFSKYLTRTNLLVKILEKLFFSDFIPRNFKNTKSRPGVFCTKPFEYAEIDIHGDIYICCPRRLNKCIGNLNKNTFFEVWNSDTAQKIRKSIFDGSYKYCIEEFCILLLKNKLPKKERILERYMKEIIRSEKTVLEKGPKSLNLGYDNSCNLSCPSCRSEIIMMPGTTNERMLKLQKIILQEGLDNVENIILSGHGDPFASRIYRELFQTIDFLDSSSKCNI